MIANSSPRKLDGWIKTPEIHDWTKTPSPPPQPSNMSRGHNFQFPNIRPNPQNRNTDSRHVSEIGMVSCSMATLSPSLFSGNLRNPETSPLYKTTISLLTTYEQINKIYYEKLDASKTKIRNAPAAYVPVPEQIDDENGDLIVKKGDILNEQYILDDAIGRGSFGQVVQAFDQKNKSWVAIKIINGKKAFFQQAQYEIEILSRLSSKNVNGKIAIVGMKDHFIYYNHQCIVFELLSRNLFDVIRQTKYKGIKLHQVQTIAWQVLKSLHFLSRSDVGVIHCDLKPENILLCNNENRNRVKIIDFGSACLKDKKMFSYIQSRYYRSPEVMLELDYGYAIDCWSVGCILVELLTGEPLFGGVDILDQMYRICLVLGLPSSQFLQNSSRASYFFQIDERGNFTMKPCVHPQTKTLKPKQLCEIIGVDGPASWYAEKCTTKEELTLFHDMVSKLLIFDPSARMTATQALEHPFFYMKRSDNTVSSTNQKLAHQNSNEYIIEKTNSNDESIHSLTHSLSSELVLSSTQKVDSINQSET